MKGEKCEVCGILVEGFEYKYCCNNYDCGCMGKPVEPCVCSEKCWNKLTEGDSPDIIKLKEQDRRGMLRLAEDIYNAGHKLPWVGDNSYEKGFSDALDYFNEELIDKLEEI